MADDTAGGIAFQQLLDERGDEGTVLYLRAGFKGEILIAENGSTGGSIEIAEKLGVRIVPVKLRVYGNALKGGPSCQVLI